MALAAFITPFSTSMSKMARFELQQNTTDIDVGQELIDMGIPKDNIYASQSAGVETIH